MVNLFERTGVEQDTGLLRERWQQEGSEAKSAYLYLDNADGTILTVTSGKVFYCQSITFFGTAALGTCRIKDDSTTMFVLKSNNVNQFVFEFPTPVIFETNVYADQDGGQWELSVVGWEEDAE